MEVDERPAVAGIVVAALFGVLATLASLAGPIGGIALVAVAVAVLVGGTAAGSRGIAILGVVLGSLGFLYQAAFGVAPVAPLVGLAAIVLAWDVGDHAIGLGEQVGRAARSRDAVLAHAAFGSVVGVLVIAVGVALYRVAPGGRPFAALLFLLLAILLLPVALRN